jgi:putative resolvase
MKNVKDAAKFIALGKARNILGVSDATLRRWAKDGKIKSIVTPTGRRLYDVEGIGGTRAPETDAVADSGGGNDQKPAPFLYARVSSPKQRDDLERQIEFLRKEHPEAEVVSDVGSGINWNRKGLRTLLDLSNRGRVSVVVVAKRDRLCRFAFELLEHVFALNGTVVRVIGSQDSSPEQELQEDLLSIVQIFCCQRNGKRRYGQGRAPRCQDTGGARDRDEEDITQTDDASKAAD